ncbi:hypothetical protein PsorP6_011636 [Peronosclerospora sorghi]|uniref:Uncharacterized protein n=1 Tax=Peronosclerospora sorghi TaxID=230839 RepID=A0ACC0WMV6_9STRA|nr:hypothetical protein PsorP6_011636 [Peronosclerospora sorghi]
MILVFGLRRGSRWANAKSAVGHVVLVFAFIAILTRYTKTNNIPRRRIKGQFRKDVTSFLSGKVAFGNCAEQKFGNRYPKCIDFLISDILGSEDSSKTLTASAERFSFFATYLEMYGMAT